MAVQQMNNPLLDCGLPNFETIKPKHFMPVINAMITAGDALLENVVTDVSDVSDWEKLVEPYIYYCMRFERILSLGSHLNAVLDEPKWRQEYQKSLQPVADFFSRWSHSEDLYKLFSNVKNNKNFRFLLPEQQVFIEHYVRDLELEGVHLKAADKAKLQGINQQLANLANNFSNNVLDATDAWKHDCKEINALKGMPGTFIEKLTNESPDDVYARVTLKSDVVQAILMHAMDRDLRKRVYEAWSVRASDYDNNAEKYDNSEYVTNILKCRHQAANLLGFNNYAELSLATKDAESVQTVINFLEKLGDMAKKSAEQEKLAIERYASDHLGIKELEPWDIAFVSEQMRQKLHNLSQEEVQQYLPIDHVLDSLLNFAERLYEISFTENNSAALYRDDVILYNVTDATGELIGYIYLDLYSQAGKRGGAWVSDYQAKAKFASEENLPVVFLVCNFTQTNDIDPALLTHSDFVTLLHEFGHAMHCLLTKVSVHGVSGFSGVAWDLVEWPSQWMENWCWSSSILEEFSQHHKEKRVLPDELIESIKATRLFNSGLAITRQVQFALTDILIHSAEKPMTAKKAMALQKSVAARYSVLPQYPKQRFLHSFSHIFAGGYAAGYYSYLWAEAMAADSFISMRELYKDDYELIGKEFVDNVLSVGALLKVDFAFNKLFKRQMNPDVLIKHLGLS